jgi:hypothetical protein
LQTTESVREKIAVAIEKLPPEGVTLAEIHALVGRDGLLLLTIFLTVVFLIPVSIPGVSTVFGGAILMIGVSRLFHRDLWLPKKILTRVVSSEKLRGALRRGLVWLERLERISKPRRLPSLTQGALLSAINNLAFILAAVLLMAPFGLIPFSNTLPAIALLFFAIGALQRDGVSVLLGHLFNLATIVYFGVLIAGGGVAIQKLIEQVRG